MRSAKLTKKASYFSLILLYTILSADPWHPEINHRPRLLLVFDEIEEVQNRLYQEPYLSLWNNEYEPNQSIYQNARRSMDPTINTQLNPRSFFDKRAWIAKDAAFVFLMNRKADGFTTLNEFTDELNPWSRSDYFDHAIEYLESIDPTVVGPNDLIELISHGPMVNNWQYRSRELINYCQAYDLLLGSGMEPNDLIEDNLIQFAENLISKYTATEYTNQYLLQRNNHKLAIGAALGMAALTLNQNQNSSKWANAGMLLIDWVCFGDPAESFDGFSLIDENGGYAEGTHYFHYSWKKLAPFFIAMKNFNGDWSEFYTSTEIDGFYPNFTSSNNLNLRSPYFDTRYHVIYDWIKKLRLPNGMLPVIEDSPMNVYASEIGILSEQYNPFYNIQITDGEPSPLIQSLTDLRSDYIVAGNHSDDSNFNNESMIFMPHSGNAILKGQNNQSPYLHINGKNGHARLAAAAHDQADVSHFEIGFSKHRLSLEGGYSGWNYRYDINKAENHNIILVNGFGPKPPSGPSINIAYSGFPPEIDIDFNTGDPSPNDGFLENAFQSTSFSYIECHTEYGQSYYREEELETLEGQEIWLYNGQDQTNIHLKRAILFIDEEYYVMHDKIDSFGDSLNTYDWRFHANAGGEADGILLENENGGIITLNGDQAVSLQIFCTTASEQQLISYPTSLHSNDILGDSGYKEHTVINVEHQAADTDFLTIFYPSFSEQITINSIENDSSYIALLIYRPANIYDVVIVQNQNNLIFIDGFTNTNGDSIPTIETSANFLLISFERNLPFNLENVRLFGTADFGSEIVSINDSTFNLITDDISLESSENELFINNFSLSENYPNPFNLKTYINYSLKVKETVNISIFDLSGRNVKNSTFTNQQIGEYTFFWDGTDNQGQILPSGMYLFKIQSGKFSEMIKMIMIK